jgi:drug/metabolite transporter (DMT)-like permease
VIAKEELLTIAQIAVTLIGFSGLIFVVRARNLEQMQPRDLSAIAMIVASGGVSLAFALLPLPLAYLDIPEDVLWRASCGAFGLTLLVTAFVFAAVDRRLTADGHPARTPRFNRTTLSLVVLMALLLSGSALGLPHSPAVYLLGLVMCVMLCLVCIALMMVVARTIAD